MTDIKKPEDIIYNNSSLEDQWFYASQKENREYEIWQLMYRMKDTFFAELVDEALSEDGVKSMAAAERVARQREEWKEYVKDMVSAESAFRVRRTNTEYIKMKYFENKASEKSENEAYFHQQPSQPIEESGVGGGMF